MQAEMIQRNTTAIFRLMNVLTCLRVEVNESKYVTKRPLGI